MTQDNEVPPLSELVNGSYGDVWPYLLSLSLPEVLIVGARPQYRIARKPEELAWKQEVQDRILDILDYGKCRG